MEYIWINRSNKIWDEDLIFNDLNKEVPFLHFNPDTILRIENKKLLMTIEDCVIQVITLSTQDLEKGAQKMIAKLFLSERHEQ